jgi:nitroreductase
MKIVATLLFISHMSIIETIKQRRSVRSYTGESLTRNQADLIMNYLSGQKAPFGANVRIEWIRAGGDGDSRPAKLGTYGWVGGATEYLALIYEEAPLAEEGAAYLFEQVILYCTALGLGTCWLGGSFSRKDFGRQVSLEPGEKLRIVSPVGYASEKKRFVESYIVGAEKNHRTRKPFGAHFFHKNFSTPLTEDAAGIYAQPLEMVRLAPSANNKQSWRVTLDGETLHFYRTFSYGFSAIDLGIALCHFGETCRETGIAGHFDVLAAPQEKNAEYAVSWIGEKRV